MRHLSPIIESLHGLFKLEKPRAIDGKYIYTELQHLKETTDCYQEHSSLNNFVKLKKAIRDSMSYIEKWKLNFEQIKNALDIEAKKHGMSPINWPKYLSHSQASPRFQFSALNHDTHEVNFLEWITRKTKKTHSELTSAELSQLLIDNKTSLGFSKKLSQHLRQEPRFLFNLAIKSKKIFTQLAKTSLILYLTDVQLAQLIVHYVPKFGPSEVIYFNQIDLFIEKLNTTLSHGRSISALLRNGNAKAILDTSVVFQIYQSGEYANKDLYPSIGWIDKPSQYSEYFPGG